ncbi:PREDICTED: uncharacterized protein LOC108370238 [Rhagoletis zephyria]|uniref:uncharacterized protein LOC108370238 n=1 Tax=Rhagoletis zephyria TaxID=28612 RepID=UPI0008114FFE|nr:PREDICTED: uncharacterized protein LOC108370238 [Rhagoletis zephyria]XP_036337396.1 uncharacterized protein LOC118747454 [Rhagoletis pomonella]
MIKFLILICFFAMAFARPGYLHSAPILTTYREQHVAALPAAVHIVEPLVTTHQIVTPLLRGAILNHGLH